LFCHMSNSGADITMQIRVDLPHGGNLISDNVLCDFEFYIRQMLYRRRGESKVVQKYACDV